MTDAAKVVIDSELSRSNSRVDYMPEIAIFGQLHVRSLDWRGMLRNLYWRARRQSAVWVILGLLVARGLLHPRRLTVPMDPNRMSGVTGIVSLSVLLFPSSG